MVRQYNTWLENYQRANETLREIFWEAKRAPQYSSTMLKNPYRREYLIKKLLGRTKAERKAKLTEIKEMAT